MSLGSEVPLESGSLDLLLADAHGRLALCEFKKGSENPDLRKVTAQILDNGASLWHLPFSRVLRRWLVLRVAGRALLALAPGC